MRLSDLVSDLVSDKYTCCRQYMSVDTQKVQMIPTYRDSEQSLVPRADKVFGHSSPHRTSLSRKPEQGVCDGQQPLSPLITRFHRIK